MGTARRGGGPSNLRIVSGGIRSLTAISAAVGSRPITCRKFRHVRKILLKAAMVATEKCLPSSFPDFCRKYDPIWSDQQDLGLTAGRAFTRWLYVTCGIAVLRSLQVANEHHQFDM